MSLLDDVSIVVTPNGYKAGELYAVIPVPTEGAELVTNGDFATDSDWTKETGWTISGDTANYDGVVAIGSISQNVTFTVGKRYKYTFTISNSTQGGVRVFVGNTAGIIHSSDGTYTGSIVYSSGAGIILQARDSFIGSIDNVSVKEYTSADMDVTRATAATRVDENGLVNYAEVIGGEEVVNGDFANGETGWSFGTNWEVVSEQATTTGVTLTPISQSVLVNGANRLTFDVISGGALVYTNYPSFSLKANFSTTGTHTIDLESDGVGTNQLLYIYNNGAGNSSTIDNISVKEVTRDNVPRIDYTGGGCPHILAEPQRTNLVTYSEDFSNAYWSKAGATITSNQAISPKGDMTASLLSIGANTSRIRVLISKTLSAAHSVYVKSAPSNSATHIRLTNNNTIAWGTGTSVKVALTDEWQRIETTDNISGNAFCIIGSKNADDTNDADCIGDVLIWGAQLEEGSYATSYIPTSGSTVTRNQDIFTRDGIGSLINSTEGVLFLEMAALDNDGTSRLISLSDGTTTKRINIYYSTSSNSIYGLLLNSSVQGITSFTLSDSTNFAKIAFKYKENDFALWVNGTEVDTDSSGTTFTSDTLNKLSFDRADGVAPFFGKVKQLQVYDTSLSDTQLAALTS